MGKAGMGPEVVQVVEAARPDRAFVDFLESHEVGPQLPKEIRDSTQV
jgi:Ni,Fe-hydrogenase maturation factor